MSKGGIGSSATHASTPSNPKITGDDYSRNLDEDKSKPPASTSATPPASTSATPPGNSEIPNGKVSTDDGVETSVGMSTGKKAVVGGAVVGGVAAAGYGATQMLSSSPPAAGDASGSSVPGSSVPGSSVPGSSVPGGSVLGNSVLGSSVPGSSVPGSSDGVPTSLAGIPGGGLEMKLTEPTVPNNPLKSAETALKGVANSSYQSAGSIYTPSASSSAVPSPTITQPKPV